MTLPQGHTLSKEERLCGKTTVSALISQGKWGVTPHLRYCWAAGRESGCNRLMVSVPKKFFKRAVRRNLLKRRLRESYRLQKELLPVPVDIAFLYLDREVLPSEDIYAAMTDVLAAVAAKTGPKTESKPE